MSVTRLLDPTSTGSSQGLKDFQRATVDHVDERLWGEGRDAAVPRRRRGRTRQDAGRSRRHREGHRPPVGRRRPHRCRLHLLQRPDRPAEPRSSARRRRDRPRLRRSADAARAARSTSLKDRKLNFVSFSPGTSFNVSDSGGRPKSEYFSTGCCAASCPSCKANHWLKFFRGATHFENFKRQVGGFDRESIPPAMSAALVDEMGSLPGRHGADTLLDELLACGEQFKYKSRGLVARTRV